MTRSKRTTTHSLNCRPWLCLGLIAVNVTFILELGMADCLCVVNFFTFFFTYIQVYHAVNKMTRRQRSGSTILIANEILLLSFSILNCKTHWSVFIKRITTDCTYWHIILILYWFYLIDSFLDRKLERDKQLSLLTNSATIQQLRLAIFN